MPRWSNNILRPTVQQYMNLELYADRCDTTHGRLLPCWLTMMVPISHAYRGRRKRTDDGKAALGHAKHSKSDAIEGFYRNAALPWWKEDRRCLCEHSGGKWEGQNKPITPSKLGLTNSSGTIFPSDDIVQSDLAQYRWRSVMVLYWTRFDRIEGTNLPGKRSNMVPDHAIAYWSIFCKTQGRFLHYLAAPKRGWG